MFENITRKRIATRKKGGKKFQKIEIIHNEKKKGGKKGGVSSLLASSRRRKEAEVKGATSGGKGKHYRDKYRNGGRGKK